MVDRSVFAGTDGEFADRRAENAALERAGDKPRLVGGKPSKVSLQRAQKQLNDKQLLFVAWIATPKPFRRPATQQELALELDVHEVTLWRWSKDPRVNEAVRYMTLHQAAGPERISDVLDFYHRTVMDVSESMKSRLVAAKAFMDAIGVKYLHERTPKLLDIKEVDEIDLSELSDDEVWELYHELARDSGGMLPSDPRELARWDSRVNAADGGSAGGGSEEGESGVDV